MLFLSGEVERFVKNIEGTTILGYVSAGAFLGEIGLVKDCDSLMSGL